MPTRKHRVWFARWNRRALTLLDHPFQEELRFILDPDRIVSRRNRQWRLSEPHFDSDGPRVWGKLGFERAQDEIVYENHDYIVREAPAAIQRTFVYYVIDIPSRVMAYEERIPLISQEGFLDAFRQISEPAGWEIDPLGDHAKFQAWLESVDRVIRYSATLVRPNPWTHAEQVRALVEEPNARTANLEVRNDSDPTGLRVRGTVIEATSEHADAGNGHYKATGVKGTLLRYFNSARKLLVRVIEVGDDETDATTVAKISRTLDDVDLPRRGPDTDE